MNGVEESKMTGLSTRLSDNGVLKLTEAIVAEDPSVKVLVLRLRESEQQILRYVEVGADGYILRVDLGDELLENVRAVDDEEALVSPNVAYALMSRVRELAQGFSDVEAGIDGPIDLTPREREVLDLIGKGLTNKEIANRLYIEVGTVKNHVHNILKKMDVSSREDAAAYLAVIK